MMMDRKEAERIAEQEPIKQFEEVVEDKMKRKKITREEAYQDIIRTSSKTRKSINKKLGLE